MTIARVKNWISEVLYAADLNAEFNNLITYLNASTIVFTKIGIGMTPSNILDITQTQNNTSAIKLLNANTSASAIAQLWLANSGTNALISLLGTGYGASGITRADGLLITAGTGAGGLTLNTGAAQPIYLCTNTTERVQISATGGVGVGMTPTNILDITQTQNAATIVSILNASSGNSASARFQATNSGAGTSAYSGCLFSNGTTNTQLTHYGTAFTTAGVHRQDGTELFGSGAGGLSIVTGVAQPIYFAISNTEAMRLSASSELLIGTTTDNGAYLLQVNSQIFATNATIATSDATLKKELPALTSDVVEKVRAVPTRLYVRTDRPQDGSRAGYFAQDWEAIFGLETGIVKKPPSGKLQLDEGAAQALKIMALEQTVAKLLARIEALEARAK